MTKLYKEGSKRVRDDTNLVNIVKKLRHLEIILDNSLLNSDARKLKVAHTYHNIINVDSDLDSDSAYEGGTSQKIRITPDNPIKKAIKHRLEPPASNEDIQSVSTNKINTP